MATLTVFTPAYNRAHTLKRTYDSLVCQSSRDFLWLIVDDGSTDETPRLVSDWQGRDNGFEIRYLHKENGGMHTAHNMAYANVDTELNMCLDSDDSLPPDAVEKILTKWAQVKHLGYGGLVGLDEDMEGRVIGKGFPPGLTETTLMGYYAAGGFGDKKLVYRTDVIRRYPPYPEYSGERYVALAALYRLIDQDYRLAVLDEVLCRVDYRTDGHTAHMWKEYLRSPRGFAYWRGICMRYPMSRRRLVVDCVHYCASGFLAKNRHFLAESPRRGLTALCLLPGWLLSLYIRRRAR